MGFLKNIRALEKKILTTDLEQQLAAANQAYASAKRELRNGYIVAVSGFIALGVAGLGGLMVMRSNHAGSVKDYESQIAKLQSQMGSLPKEYADLKKSFTDLTEKKNVLDKELGGLVQALEQTKADVTRLNASVVEKDGYIVTLEGGKGAAENGLKEKVVMYETKLAQNKSDLDAAQKRVDLLQDTLRNNEKEIAILSVTKRERDAAYAKNIILEGDLAAVKGDRDRLQTSLDDISVRFDSLKAEADRLGQGIPAVVPPVEPPVVSANDQFTVSDFTDLCEWLKGKAKSPERFLQYVMDPPDPTNRDYIGKLLDESGHQNHGLAKAGLQYVSRNGHSVLQMNNGSFEVPNDIHGYFNICDKNLAVSMLLQSTNPSRDYADANLFKKSGEWELKVSRGRVIWKVYNDFGDAQELISKNTLGPGTHRIIAFCENNSRRLSLMLDGFVDGSCSFYGRVPVTSNPLVFGPLTSFVDDVEVVGLK
ncbi:MAG: hypothetical protein Q7R96_01575 [Nanoarchaeota archaeon]|nr:hypothetical protein [Nanoarchaeota archaeon]